MRADERGSVSIWLALAAFVMIVLVGLAVDLSGQVSAATRAHDLAAQAARAAGQQLDVGQAVRGGAAQVGTGQAIAAGRAYLAAAGIDGEVAVTDGGSTLVVTTTARYDTVFLSIIGIGHLTATGRSEAHPVRAASGSRR